ESTCIHPSCGNAPLLRSKSGRDSAGLQHSRLCRIAAWGGMRYNPRFLIGANMPTISINVDADLAREYIDHYRAFQPDPHSAALDDVRLLEAFMHDRLREEIQFMVKEVE